MLRGGLLIDQVKLDFRDMQFAELVDLIYLEYPNPPKIISQCSYLSLGN